MKKKEYIWIGLPAFNEEIAIKKVLQSIIEINKKINIKIIIFNDGSKDKTVHNAKKFKKSLKIFVIDNKKNQGLGTGIFALINFFNKNGKSNDKLVLMDCDNTHNPKQIFQMKKKMNGKKNIVIIASRYQKNSQVKNVPFFRKILSDIAFIVFNICYKTKGIKDFTCGFRMYDKLSIKNFFEQIKKNYNPPNGFEIQLEILLQLRKKNIQFDEIPINLNYEKKPTESKMKIFKTIINYLKLIFLKN